MKPCNSSSAMPTYLASFQSILTGDTPKTNISPVKRWSDDNFPFEIVPFFMGHLNFAGGLVIKHGFVSSLQK